MATMESDSSFIEIGSIEHDLTFSKDQVQDVYTETQGSLKIYITSAREWSIYEHPCSVSLGKIQSLVTEIYSGKLNFFELLDPSTRIIPNVESILEQVINIFDLDRRELRNLKTGISLILEKAGEDVEKRGPREFDIQVFIEILETEEVSSDEEFEGKYGGLFKGVSADSVLRMKKLEGCRGVEQISEEVSSCRVCFDEFLEGVEVVIMPCGDMFHKKCIGRWLNQRNNTCLKCQWSCTRKNECDSSASVEQRLRKLKMVMS